MATGQTAGETEGAWLCFYSGIDALLNTDILKHTKRSKDREENVKEASCHLPLTSLPSHIRSPGSLLPPNTSIL